jgi:hypothetical protein
MTKMQTVTHHAAMFALAALVCFSRPALAQSGGTSNLRATNTDQAQAANPPGPASSPTKAELRAKRKTERHQTRVAKNAELKRLEDAGYQPGQYDPNYPANLQNAEKPAVGK